MNITPEQLEAFHKGAASVYVARGVPEDVAAVLLDQHLNKVAAELNSTLKPMPTSPAQSPPRTPPPGVPTNTPTVSKDIIQNPPIKV